MSMSFQNILVVLRCIVESLWAEVFGSNVVKHHINSDYSLFFSSFNKSCWLWYFWQTIPCLSPPGTGSLCQPWSCWWHCSLLSFACTRWPCVHSLDKFALTLLGSNLKIYLKGSICRRFCTCSQPSMYILDRLSSRELYEMRTNYGN